MLFYYRSHGIRYILDGNSEHAFDLNKCLNRSKSRDCSAYVRNYIQVTISYKYLKLAKQTQNLTDLFTDKVLYRGYFSHMND